MNCPTCNERMIGVANSWVWCPVCGTLHTTSDNINADAPTIVPALIEHLQQIITLTK